MAPMRGYNMIKYQGVVVGPVLDTGTYKGIFTITHEEIKRWGMSEDDWVNLSCAIGITVAGFLKKKRERDNNET